MILIINFCCFNVAFLDYVPVSSQLTFDADNRMECVRVLVLADRVVEETEQFHIVLESQLEFPGNVSIVTSLVNIVDSEFGKS